MEKIYNKTEEVFKKTVETLSEEVDEKRYRHFMILLYKDSTIYDYENVLFDLKGSFKNYAYNEHKPESNEKKSHTHFILSLDNPRSIESLSNRIEIPKNYIEPIKSLRASCRYLIHLDHEKKIQYELADVLVSRAFSRKFYSSFDDLKTEEDVIDDIYLFIDSLEDNTYRDAIKQLIFFVNSSSYDTIYKRYRVEFMDYLREILSSHNI